MDFGKLEADIEALKDRLSRNERVNEDEIKAMWESINKLKESHGTHDTLIQKLILSLEHMSKEFTKSLDELATTLGKHLEEEQKGMKDTIKELKAIGWKVFYAIILAGLAGQFGVKFIG